MGNIYEQYVYDADVCETTECQENKFLALAGEDRGARINITRSTFKHSKFCKGLLTYRREPAIQFKDLKTFLNITASQERFVNISDNRNESFIIIDRSEFENIGYHLVVNTLGARQKKNNVDGISQWLDYEWPLFEDRGLILNIQGFNGTVEISNSTFNKNMAYIKDVLIEPYSIAQKFIDPENLSLS